MKITQSQKISFSLLGLAACAYVLDLSFGASGAPHRPAASEEHPVNLNAAAPLSPSETANSDATELADRLQALQSSGHITLPDRDAFAIPTAFLAGIDAGQLSINERISRFKHSHVLKAVICSNGNCQAVVDSSLIKVGQSIDGFKLDSLDPMRAVFLGGEVRTELTIEKPD